jgi:decaprenyl-phosphate phosphoribosyltransferase
VSHAVRSVGQVSGAPAAEPLAGWRSTLPGGLLRTARPKQWIKNLLVFAAPGAAGVLGQSQPLLRSLLAFVIFCVVASGTYFLNDTLDLAADRLHPRKRLRPVAAGVVSVALARLVGSALAVAGLGLSLVLSWKVTAVIGVYLGVQAAYTLWLKHQPIFDLAAVASGFVLRAIAGGLAVRVPISEWFLIVATFGSLFMVTGKRLAEHDVIGDGARGDGARGHDTTPSAYTSSFLRSILTTASTVTIAAYCLWAFENQKAAHHGIWFQLSIVPFVLAMLRYGFLLDQGQGGQPEDVVLGDRTLQVVAVIWAVVFALGVYG